MDGSWGSDSDITIEYMEGRSSKACLYRKRNIPSKIYISE